MKNRGLDGIGIMGLGYFKTQPVFYFPGNGKNIRIWRKYYPYRAGQPFMFYKNSIIGPDQLLEFSEDLFRGNIEQKFIFYIKYPLTCFCNIYRWFAL